LRDPRAASVGVPKHLLGLPQWDAATERQRRDGMCYKSESELYNGGNAFKLCARDARGVVVTHHRRQLLRLLQERSENADQLLGESLWFAEEEHAGGALVFPSYNEGQEYTDLTAGDAYSLKDVLARPDRFVVQPEGTRSTSSIRTSCWCRRNRPTACARRPCRGRRRMAARRRSRCSPARPIWAPTATACRWSRRVPIAVNGISSAPRPT
jgi:hypothetical protein